MLAGAYLAEEYPIKADVVIGVPDSGLVAAKGYALASGIPYNDGFVKNRYIARTFIKPTQSSREAAVKLKLNPLRSTVSAKTRRHDRRLSRPGHNIRPDHQAPAGRRGQGGSHALLRAEVHQPCYFGTDIPSKKELFACNHTTEEMCEIIGADSLGFLSLNNLHKIAPDAKCGFCDACFSENYPISGISEGKCCG